LLQDQVTNAAVLFDQIRERGYAGGRSILWEFLHPLRELAADRVTVRFETAPGKQGQVDWGTFRKPGFTRVQAFALTLGWSRASHLDFSETQALPALLRCHEWGRAARSPVRPDEDRLAVQRSPRGPGLSSGAARLCPAPWLSTAALLLSASVTPAPAPCARRSSRQLLRDRR